VEFAQPGGRSTDFPKIWGRPAGDRWSEERADWIRAQIGRFAGMAALDRLARRDVKYLCDLRKAIVASRRTL
jgi:hypothetical protein